MSGTVPISCGLNVGAEKSKVPLADCPQCNRTTRIEGQRVAGSGQLSAKKRGVSPGGSDSCQKLDKIFCVFLSS